MSSLWPDCARQEIRDFYYACPGNKYIERIQAETVGHRFARTEELVYHENGIAGIPNIRSQVDRRVRPSTLCFNKYDKMIYDRSDVQVGFKGRLFMAE